MDEQSNTPQYSGQPTEMPGKKSSLGSVVGAIIVIIAIILGGLYFWGSQLEDQQMLEEELPFILGDEDVENEGIPPTSSSDELSSIETDIQANNLDGLEAAIDADLENVNSEL